LLQGCDLGADTTTTTPWPEPSPWPSPAPLPLVPTPAPTPGQKIPLYLVLRMDDVWIGNWLQMGVRTKDAVDWAREKHVPLNLGIIAAQWPTNCVEDPQATSCQDPAVNAIFDAYKSGDVLLRTKPGHTGTLELGCHAFNHTGWPLDDPKTRGRAWMTDDLNKATRVLHEAFPGASLRTFTPPQNLVDADALKIAEADGWDIVTTQATMRCNQASHDYIYGPCEMSEGQYACAPKDDVYATSNGFQKVEGTNVFTTPDGCANTDYTNQAGISAKATLGDPDTCGCVDDDSGITTCSVIASAEENAKRSNGLRWTVMMMHPQSLFPQNQSYREWLDEFYIACQEQSTYDIQFIHFQDLVRLAAPGSQDRNFYI